MRFYSACNMYLSSIQQGIQAAHCVGEMALKIVGNKYVSEWLTEHKTLICVNGGNYTSLRAFHTLCTDARNTEYPVAHFSEDYDSLAGMLTTVGIIVPAKIYEADLTEFGRSAPELTPWELELALALKRMPLAR
jgi:hypothetical protein